MERRDNRNRVLKNGESQRQDGRYTYKYIDKSGKQCFIYSWRLVATDRLPKGKRECKPLREMIAELNRDIQDGIDTQGRNMTLNQLYEKYIKGRANVTKSTAKGRQSLVNALKEDKLGNTPIDRIKPSDAREWAIRMSGKYSYNTINNMKRSLIKAFYIAIEDDYVRKNPFTYNLAEVIEDDRETRQALTESQERELLSFAESDRTYSHLYDSLLILLNTGLRISEFCGLTENDLDFEAGMINVDHQLLSDTKTGYYINRPKTQAGIRKVPMSATVREAFQRVLERRKNADIQPIEVDGYKGFLFLNRHGYPMLGTNYAATLNNLVKKYNKTHEGEPLPHIAPHMLRHTFCSRMANRNMSPKALQYIMGHADISITLNLYTHVTMDGIKAEMARLTA